MNILEKFVEKARKTECSFVVDLDDGGELQCMQLIKGTARFIYGIDSRDRFVDLDEKPKLIALAGDDNVFLMDRYYFRMLLDKKMALPNSVYWIDNTIKEKDHTVTEQVNRQMYDALEVNPNDSSTNCREKARGYVLRGETQPAVDYLFTSLSRQDIADWLCGFVTLEECAKKRFLERKDYWLYMKNVNTMIKRYMKDPFLVDPYETEIAKALLPLEDRNNLTVEFEKNEKTAVGKISVQKLWNVLIKKDSFSSYMFHTNKSGEQLLQALGCNEYLMYTRRGITCKEIASISYRNKVIYNRRDTRPMLEVIAEQAIQDGQITFGFDSEKSEITAALGDVELSLDDPEVDVEAFYDAAYITGNAGYIAHLLSIAIEEIIDFDPQKYRDSKSWLAKHTAAKTSCPENEEGQNE